MQKQQIKDVVVKDATDLTEEQIRETIEAYSENASIYARMWTWNLAHRDQVKDQQIIKFTHYVESGAKVLVAGSGAGRDLEMLVDEGFDCLALDISKEMLRESKERGVKAKYLVHDLRKPLMFPNGHFNAIYCESVFEHIPKREAQNILKELHRVLIPRGILYLGVKKGEGEVYYRFDVGNEKHRRFYNTYNDVEFHQLIASEGFVLLEYWIDDHFDRQTHQWLSAIVRKN